MKGLVIKSVGSSYTVLTTYGKKIECRIKGRLRIDGYKSTNPIAVGDKVEFAVDPDGIGAISAVDERKNCIIRKSKNLSKQSHILATNVDQAMLIITLSAPKTSFGFIDRFLATAEAYRIPAILIFNKADMHENDEISNGELKKAMSVYENIGYKCYSVSSTSMSSDPSTPLRVTKEELTSVLKDKITLLSGHSGVGKSTFVNAIEPSFALKTQKISGTHDKGMHTTTFTEMHQMSFSGFIIDTPGIKEFSVINMDKYEISHFFPEIFKRSSECKFNTCLHLNEPKCAVIAAVEKGEIALSRYHSYLSIMNGEEVIKEYND